MKFGVSAETHAGEAQAAAAPETVKKVISSGYHTVLVQSGAGTGTSIPGKHCIAAGATIVLNSAEA
jgi:NAD/NADP transhydrogenase alpha subunit